MAIIETIAALLAERNLAGLQGLKEDQWFDAKRATTYALATPTGRFELAKDVSSFANAEGGYILIGLTTVEVPDEQTEQVNGLDLLTENSFSLPLRRENLSVVRCAVGPDSVYDGSR